MRRSRVGIMLVATIWLVIRIIRPSKGRDTLQIHPRRNPALFFLMAFGDSPFKGLTALETLVFLW